MPIVVTGFEPLDILEGIRRTVLQLESRPARGGERLPARGAGRGQPGGAGDAAATSSRSPTGPGAASAMIPAQRLAAVASATATSTPSTGSPSPTSHTAESADLPVRRGAAGADQAARVRGVRHGVHAAQPARRDDGLLRGRLRGLLPVPAGSSWWSRLMPEDEPAAMRPSTSTGWACPAAAARLPDHRDGPRRRRRDVGRADRAPVPAGLRRARPTPSWATPRSLAVGGARLAFSTDSFVVQAAVLPRRHHRRPRRQRHGQRPGHVGRDGRWCSPRRSSSRRAPRWPTSAGSPPPSARPRVAAGVELVTGDTKVVDAGHGDGVLHQHRRASGCCRRRASTSGPARARPGDVVIVSGDIGVHGVAVMSCREGLEFGTAVASDTAPLHGLVAAMLGDRRGHPRAARPDPGRGRGLAERDRQGGGGRHRAGRAGPARSRTPSATPAGCSASTRSTSPTRASWSRSSPRTTRSRCSPRCGPTRWGPAAAVDRSTASPSTPAWWSARTGLGGTRVVDLPIGEQLPRIC